MPDDFPDHFSGHAALYARHRPRYPAALFEWIAAHAPAHERCWDCATGSGQAARSLRAHFAEVVATDASTDQLQHAAPMEGVVFRQALAEASGLPEASVDLVSAAAGAHWFDLPRFYAEVRRVARPGALVALWTYGAAPRIDGQPAETIAAVAEALTESWPPEFALVRAAYRTLPFPFAELSPPPFVAEARWRLDELLGFVRSWSGYQRHRQRTGVELLDTWAPRIAEEWGDAPDTPRAVQLPLAMRAGHV